MGNDAKFFASENFTNMLSREKAALWQTDYQKNGGRINYRKVCNGSPRLKGPAAVSNIIAQLFRSLFPPSAGR